MKNYKSMMNYFNNPKEKVMLNSAFIYTVYIGVCNPIFREEYFENPNQQFARSDFFGNGCMYDTTIEGYKKDLWNQFEHSDYGMSKIDIGTERIFVDTKSLKKLFTFFNSSEYLTMRIFKKEKMKLLVIKDNQFHDVGVIPNCVM